METSNQLKKAVQDIIIMAVLMILALFVIFVLIPQQIPLNLAAKRSGGFNSRTFPNALMWTLFALSFFGFAKAVFQVIHQKKIMRSGLKMHISRKELLELLIPYITYALILLYCILFGRIGYIFSTLLIPPVVMFVLGCRKWRLYISTYVFGALMYVIFKVFMDVPLP